MRNHAAYTVDLNKAVMHVCMYLCIQLYIRTYCTYICTYIHQSMPNCVMSTDLRLLEQNQKPSYITAILMVSKSIPLYIAVSSKYVLSYSFGKMSEVSDSQKIYI